MEGLSPELDPRPVSVRFVMDTVASEQIFLRIFLFSPVSIIPPTFHARWFIYHRHYVTLKTDSVVKQLALKTKRGHLEVLSVGRKKGGGGKKGVNKRPVKYAK